MASTAVELGSLRLKSRDSKLSLHLTSTISLDLPPGLDYITSAEDIAELVKDGKLWLSRAGSCRLRVIATTNGNPLVLSDPFCRDGQHLLDAINSCPIWSQVKLTLVRDTRDTANSQAATEAHFSLDHPASEIGLVSPPRIPKAEFHGIACRFNFEVTRLTSRRQKAGLPRSTSRTNQSSQTLESFADAAQGAKATALTHAAIYSLIGVEKRIRGVVGVEPRESPSLVDIAPAVWNVHYLRAVATTSVFLPSVTADLARLSISAQSSGLRHKAIEVQLAEEVLDPDVQPLALDLSSYEPHVDPQNMKRRLWEVLLKGVPRLVRNESRYQQRLEKASPSLRENKVDNASENENLYEQDIWDDYDYDYGGADDVEDAMAYHDHRGHICHNIEEYLVDEEQSSMSQENISSHPEDLPWPDEMGMSQGFAPQIEEYEQHDELFDNGPYVFNMEPSSRLEDAEDTCYIAMESLDMLPPHDEISPWFSEASPYEDLDQAYRSPESFVYHTEVVPH